jgi:hypothetical protein
MLVVSLSCRLGIARDTKVSIIKKTTEHLNNICTEGKEEVEASFEVQYRNSH